MIDDSTLARDAIYQEHLTTWRTFTRFTTYATIAAAVLLAAMGLFLV